MNDGASGCMVFFRFHCRYSGRGNVNIYYLPLEHWGFFVLLLEKWLFSYGLIRVCHISGPFIHVLMLFFWVQFKWTCVDMDSFMLTRSELVEFVL